MSFCVSSAAAASLAASYIFYVICTRLCHLHSVVFVVIEPVACSDLMFSGSSDHKCQENGGDHEGKEQHDRAVEGVRAVIESARDDCRKGCKECVGRND